MAKLTGIIAEKKEKSMSYVRENLLPSETNNCSKGFRSQLKEGLYNVASAISGKAALGVAAIVGVCSVLAGTLGGGLMLGSALVGLPPLHLLQLRWQDWARKKIREI